MNKITTKVASRTAVAAALSLGMTVGAIGVASASPVSHHRSSHNGHKSHQSLNRVEGIVAAYVAGTSITVTPKGATTPTTYTLTSATVINGLAVGGTLAVGADVDLLLSSTTPTTVSSISVETPRAMFLSGVVTAYVAGTSISITPRWATTPTTYALTSSTVISGLAVGATLAVGAQVNLMLSTTTPVTVTSITVEAPKPVRVEAVVSSYTAGSSITVLANGATTPTTYTLTSTTTVTGLAAGATLASPANVDLVLSSTSPTTVTAIFVEANGEGNGHANPGFGHSGHGQGGFAHQGDQGFGSPRHGGRH